MAEASKPATVTDSRERSGGSLDATGELSRKQDVAPSAAPHVSSSASPSRDRFEMAGTPSAGGRREQVEDASRDDIVVLPETVVSLRSERAKTQSEEAADGDRDVRKSKDATTTTPSEASVAGSAPGSEGAGSREERSRREKGTHKTGGHMTLGSFLDRLGRTNETPALEERDASQVSRRRREPEEEGAASRATTMPPSSSPARAVRPEPAPRPEPKPRPETKPEAEPARERYGVAEGTGTGSAPRRNSFVRNYEASSRPESRVVQDRGYVRYEPNPEPKSEPSPAPQPEPKPESSPAPESDMTTVIDKSSRPAPQTSRYQPRVEVAHTPAAVEETPEPEYAPASDETSETERVAQQASAAHGSEAGGPAAGEEAAGQARKDQQPRHARHGEANAKGSGIAGLLARFKPQPKAPSPRAAGRGGQADAPKPTSPAERANLPKRRRMLILAVATTIVAAAVAGVVYLITSAGPGGSTAEVPAQQMITAMVYRGDFVDAINVEGTVDPLIVMDVNGEVDGIVENLVIGQGSFVTAGDTLFKIRNEALESAVVDATARLSEAERTVNDTDLAYRQSQADYQNAWNVAAMGNSWATFDQTGLTNAINAAAARRSEAIAARDAANSALVAAQAALDRCNVRAPISGIVMELNVANGVSVGAGTPDLAGGTTGPLLKIGDITQMKVTTLVGEAYVPFVNPGQVATVTFPALPGITQTASVNAVSSTPSGVAADASGTASYAVEFLLAGSDPNLKPGMSALLNIVLQSASDSLIVPSKAIWQEIDEVGVTHYFVNVVAGSGELRKSEVSIVAQNNDEAAVWGEVSEGDIVRVNG